MAEISRVRVAWGGSSVVGPTVSTLFFFPTTPGSAAAQSAVDKVRDFLAGLKTAIGAGTTWTVQGQVDDLESTTGALIQSFAVTPRTDGGSATGTPAPPQDQVNIRFETGVILRGRRVRGHLYVPGYPQFNSSGQVQGTMVTNVAAAMPAFLTPAVAPVVWSRPVGLHGASRLGQAIVITGGAAQTKMAVLRSRRD